MQKSVIIAIVVLLVLGVGTYLIFNKPRQNTPTSVQDQSGYHLHFTNDFTKIIPGQPAELSFTIQDSQGAILKSFQIDHTKLLHFIVIRKDLQEFQHVHPTLDPATGIFTINFTFPAVGPYRLFADFAPNGAPMGSDGMVDTTVIYQDVSIGNLTDYQAQPVVADTQTTKSFSGYDVTFNFPQQITAGQLTDFSLHITKNGKPVTDLQDYLGAVAHTIILGQSDLSYLHIHAVDRNGRMATTEGSMPGMDMGDAATGPDLNFQTTFAKPGNYKLFTQFQINGSVITTDYVINVK
jgi:hypothetical protein